MPLVEYIIIKNSGGYVADHTATPIELTPDINLAEAWSTAAARNAVLATLGNGFTPGIRTPH